MTVDPTAAPDEQDPTTEVPGSGASETSDPDQPEEAPEAIPAETHPGDDGTVES